MPTRADLDAARPRCPMLVLTPGIPAPSKDEDLTTCDRPMRYHPGSQKWACPEHGQRLTAAQLVARQQ